MGDEYWNDTRLFYNRGAKIFTNLARKTHISAYGVEYAQKLKQQQKTLTTAPSRPVDNFPSAQPQRKRHGMKSVDSTESAALHSESNISASETNGIVTRKRGHSDTPHTSSRKNDTTATPLHGLPKALCSRPYPPTAVPMCDQVMSVESALHSCCLDVCGVCASSGCVEYMLFCADCGECFHSFCVGVDWDIMCKYGRSASAQSQPSLPPSSFARWKCPNCREFCSICKKIIKEDVHSLRCQSCENRYHAKCLSPMPVSSVSNFICGACLTRSPGCVSCTAQLQCRWRNVKIFVGDVYFRQKKISWSPEHLCIRCFCADVYLAGLKCLSSVIALNTQCTICKDDCANDAARTKQCLCCFAYTHSACLTADTPRHTFELNSVGGKYMCDDCWVALDSRYGDVNSFRTVRSIQSRFMESSGLSVRESIAVNADDVPLDGLMVCVYKGVIVWAACRCQAMSACHIPRGGHSDFVASDDYTRCLAGAARFHQEWVSLGPSGDGFAGQALVDQLLQRIRSPRRLLQVACSAACFIYVTMVEWMHLSRNGDVVASCSDVPLALPHGASLYFTAKKLRETTKLSSEDIITRSSDLIRVRRRYHITSFYTHDVIHFIIYIDRCETFDVVRS